MSQCHWASGAGIFFCLEKSVCSFPLCELLATGLVQVIKMSEFGHCKMCFGFYWLLASIPCCSLCVPDCLITVQVMCILLQGWVDTTYLDDDFRIGRGDKGSVFVTARQAPNRAAPR